MSTNFDQKDTLARSTMHNSRGIELAERGWLDEAIIEFKHAITNNPECAQSYDNLASAYADKGDLLAALCHYAKALSMEPDNPCALHNLGCFLVNHGHNMAVMSFKRANRIEPDFYESRYNLGLCLAQEGKHEQAISHFESVLVDGVDEAEIRFQLALSLIELGHNARAIKELRKVVDINKEHEAAWLCLGQCYVEQGFLLEAEKSFTKTLLLNPLNIDAVLSLASLLAQLNRSKESKSLCKKACRLDKKYAQDYIAADEHL
jgi:tetratricopeptide (TPR) repeat protein